MNESRFTLADVFKNIIYILKKTKLFGGSFVILSLALMLLSAAKPFMEVMLQKYIIDGIVYKYDPQKIILFVAMIFIALILISFFSVYLKNIINTNVTSIINGFMYSFTEKNLTTDFINTENPTYLNKSQTARMSLYTVGNVLFMKIFLCMANIIVCIGYITVLSPLHPIVIVYICATGLLSYFIKKNPAKYEFSKRDELSGFDRHIETAHNTMSDFSYGKDIRVYNVKDMLVKIYENALNSKISINKKISIKYLKMEIIEKILLYAQQGCIYLYLIYEYLNNTVTIGNFAIYSIITTSLTGLLQVVMSDLSDIRSKSRNIDDIRNFLDEEAYASVSNEVTYKTLPLPPYSIQFKNVYFKYLNSEDYLLKDFSLTISEKEKLAIVGRNGAGKSTIIKLICRFYEPNSGEILLNGINISHFSKEKYMAILSTVFQDIHILAFSAIENITLKEINETAEEEVNRAKEALEKVSMYETVMSLKLGLNTPLLNHLDDDGVQLSGGQNQKISLARAIYKNGEVLMLDEPTSALDPIAESDLYKRFSDVTNGKTSIYISHRLSSTQFCDNIVFLENGLIEEYGTHKELMEKKGKYWDMFLIQAQYYVTNLE